KPSEETKEPEPPLLNRTLDFRRWSSHSCEGSKPYFSLRYFNGGFVKSHMPSSAAACRAPPRHSSNARDQVVSFIRTLREMRPDLRGAQEKNSSEPIALSK